MAGPKSGLELDQIAAERPQRQRTLSCPRPRVLVEDSVDEPSPQSGASNLPAKVGTCARTLRNAAATALRELSTTLRSTGPRGTHARQTNADSAGQRRGGRGSRRAGHPHDRAQRAGKGAGANLPGHDEGGTTDDAHDAARSHRQRREQRARARNVRRWQLKGSAKPSSSGAASQFGRTRLLQ